MEPPMLVEHQKAAMTRDPRLRGRHVWAPLGLRQRLSAWQAVAATAEPGDHVRRLATGCIW